jgi:hypothetical protein
MKLYKFIFSLFALFTISSNFILANPRILHLTFHRGCANEFAGVGKKLNLSVDTWLIPDLPPHFFDGKSSSSTLYNIDHEMAKRIWDIHKDTFLQYDVIITSDTAPLSRIFLQNNFSKPLIIWICNRFDYCDYASLNSNFPDAEYYKLFNSAITLDNVKVVAYTQFEHSYAMMKGVNTGNITITPSGINVDLSHFKEPLQSFIPSSIQKESSFFLPSYHNETNFMDFENFCKNLNIPCYRGHYNGPFDLKNFKGIIHLPYAWSNLALFETIALGIPYFIPSKTFIEELNSRGNYWYQDASFLFTQKLYEISEWYDPKHKDIFVYFDSWADLQDKIASLEYEKQRKTILEYSEKLKKETLEKWSSVLQDLTKEK